MGPQDSREDVWADDPLVMLPMEPKESFEPIDEAELTRRMNAGRGGVNDGIASRSSSFSWSSRLEVSARVARRSREENWGFER